MCDRVSPSCIALFLALGIRFAAHRLNEADLRVILSVHFRIIAHDHAS